MGLGEGVTRITEGCASSNSAHAGVVRAGHTDVAEGALSYDLEQPLHPVRWRVRGPEISGGARKDGRNKAVVNPSEANGASLRVIRGENAVELGL